MAEDRSKPPASGKPPLSRTPDDLTAPVNLPDTPGSPEAFDLDELDDIFAEIDAPDDATGIQAAAPGPASRRPQTLPPPLPAGGFVGDGDSGPILDEDPDLGASVMSFAPPPGSARAPSTLPPPAGDPAEDAWTPAPPEMPSAPAAGVLDAEPWQAAPPSPGDLFDDAVAEPPPMVAAASRGSATLPPATLPPPDEPADADPWRDEPTPAPALRPAPPVLDSDAAMAAAPADPAPAPMAGAATRARLAGRRTTPPESAGLPSSSGGSVAAVEPTPPPAPPPPHVNGGTRTHKTTPPPVVARDRDLERPLARESEPPPHAEPEEPSVFNDHGLFRAEVQRLARTRDWTRLAAVTSAAIDDAVWAKLPETSAALLEDLARIYRDRLKDTSSAEDVFKRLATQNPANPAAMEFLAERFTERGDWKALFDMHAAAIEATWDPDQRLAWTRESVRIAHEHLGANDLVVDAWERLERLGDAPDETRRALSETYRKTARWDKLAEFLARRADKLTGAERVVALREVSEAYLSGLRDQLKASEVLEQILRERPNDPIALLSLARVLARRKEWEQLAGLGARPLAGQGQAATLDFRRLVADALWSAGDLERAIVAHERVLELDPADKDALKVKEEYLEKTAKYAELVSFLETRADKVVEAGAAGGDTKAAEEQHLALLARAARLAEQSVGDRARAVALWEKHALRPAGKMDAARALEQLYGLAGDHPGVARALESQLVLTRERGARIELLRRLGEHCAHRMGDDKRAEECWKELVGLAPDDRATADELLALQRRRGDFEGLDRTLLMQGWRATDDGAVLGFWRHAAGNVEDNLNEPTRATRAWYRVLDLAPGDAEALGALVKHKKAAGPRDALAALEDQLRATADVAARIPLALEIGALWETVGDKAGALAAYERVLRWAPRHDGALAALVRLHGETGAGVAIGALDVASAHADSEAADKLALARRAATLLPAHDKLGRFFALRRVLWLADDAAALAALAEAADAPEAWSDLAAVYLVLASAATDPARRAALLGELAALYEHKLKDPQRAFLALEGVGHDPAGVVPALDALGRLAAATNRHEDHLALLDVAARAGAAPAARAAALRKRAGIVEEHVGDKERAFQECLRLLALDPADAEALTEARRLAAARSLWRQLDALYAELWDRAPGNAERLALLKARHGVHAQRLESPAGALDQLLTSYRLDAAQPELTAQILAAGEEQGAWEKIVPILEARVRAAGDTASADELAEIAALHEHKRRDPGRAFELYAEAFVLSPTTTKLGDELERLAGATGREAALAHVLRLAAARTGDPARRLELLRKVAALAEGKLARPDDALDAHRRILQLNPAETASLEVVITQQRAAGLHRELRESLGRWVELRGADASPAERTERLLEIAGLSRRDLGDPETALATYGKILEADADNAAALEGVRSLTEGSHDPALEARRLRLQLARQTGAARVELQLALAKLLEEEFEDLGEAATVLEHLVADSGATGPGFEPLSRLYAAQKRWTPLLDLHEARAAVLEGAPARVAALAATRELAEQHVDEPAYEARIERLCKKLLEERPDDEATRRRLKSLYRGAGRYEDLAQVLEAELAALPAPKAGDKDAGERRALLEDELARLYDCGLGRLADAQKVQEARLAQGPAAPDLLPALASLRLRQDDFAGYLRHRIAEAKQAGGERGALILCHLAEACDERGEPQAKVAELYRDARVLDAKCEPAVEALKAIGRRSKNWRAGAALLPEDPEGKLPWRERSARLAARGDAATHDEAGALEMYLRAVAVDPTNYAAWDALARVATARDDEAAALAAQSASLHAYERAHAPEAKRLREHAERIQRLAESRAATKDSDGAARLSRRAHELCPTFPAAALAVADLMLQEQDLAGAHAIYDRVLSDRGEALSDAERLHATFERGALAARLGRTDQAISDLRDALRIDPLHSGALNALADVLAERSRHAAAIQHYTQALLVATDLTHRGQLYARLGRLWEDHMASGDEAAVCYERALAVVDDDRDLLRRGLRLYQKGGRHDRALEVIEKLLPGATEARELAELWTARGELLGGRDDDKAIEAFDMALSYDPGAPGALGGLAGLLERRGEWAQLLDIFEARTESGTAEERAAALRNLARIAGDKLNDAARAEKYLKQAIDLAPLPEDYEALLRTYGDDPARERERRGVIAGLLATSGPWTSRLGDLGKRIAESGDRRLAWCLLSPLAGLTIPDAALKGLVLELRKEFEKSENIDILSPDLHERVRHSGADAALMEVLAEIDLTVPLGPATADAIGAQGTSKADARTALGKTFAALAEKVGLPGATLWRAQMLPGAPYRVLDAAEPTVVVRSELLQLLPIPEINLLFTSLLELTRPGARLVSSLEPGDAAVLPAAILAAAGAGFASDPVVEALASKLRAAADEATRKRWAAALGDHPLVAPDGGQSVGKRLAGAVVETARRVALLGTPDLRTAARLLTRLDENLPKMPTGGPLADMDAFLGGAPPVKALVGFAASVEFGRALNGL